MASSASVLDRILRTRQQALEQRKRVVPLAVLRMAVEKQPPEERGRDFLAALRQHPLAIIAELKRASPSAGRLREDYRPEALAEELAQAGAAALSVLTEEAFFEGTLEDLRRARRRVSIPVLRKDFLFDPWQVWESRAAGADSFLLIAALLDAALLGELIALGRQLGMEPLVEVHDRDELARAVRAGARLIGVNNRDLYSFRVDLQTSLQLIRHVPDDCLAVSESGLARREQLLELRAAGFRAFLVGEALMRAPAPGAALAALLADGS